MERIETKKVAHLIIGLGNGGAEKMLYNTIKYATATIPYTSIVISMGEGDYYSKKIQDLGVKVIEYDLRHHPFSSYFHIKKTLQDVDTLCCWMYHANVIGYFAGHKTVKRIIWNIRHSDVDRKNSTLLSWFFVMLGKRFSKKPDMITYNGLTALRNHQRIGYNNDNNIVLDNGCDLDEFSQIKDAKVIVCEKYGISPKSEIILSVARNHPIKDISTFIRAISRIKQVRPNMVAIMCGRGIESTNKELVDSIKKHELNVNSDVFLIGERDDLPLFFSAADIYILHSKSEAFPNTLIQAMACECVAISTDVGEVSKIMGGKECVVPVGDDAMIACKVERLLDNSEEYRRKMGKLNRERVMKQYDIHKIITEYEQLYF